MCCRALRTASTIGLFGAPSVVPPREATSPRGSSDRTGTGRESRLPPHGSQLRSEVLSSRKP